MVQSFWYGSYRWLIVTPAICQQSIYFLWKRMHRLIFLIFPICFDIHLSLNASSDSHLKFGILISNFIFISIFLNTMEILIINNSVKRKNIPKTETYWKYSIFKPLNTCLFYCTFVCRKKCNRQFRIKYTFCFRYLPTMVRYIDALTPLTAIYWEKLFFSRLNKNHHNAYGNSIQLA